MEEDIRVIMQVDGTLYELVMWSGGRKSCEFNPICEDAYGDSGCNRSEANTNLKHICNASVDLCVAGGSRIRHWRKLCP